MADEFESRVRQLMGEARHAAPVPPAWDDIGTAQPTPADEQRPRWLLIAAVVAVVVAGVVGIAALGRDTGDEGVSDQPVATSVPIAEVSTTLEPASTTAQPPANTPPPEPAPALVVAEPAVAAPGATVELTFPEETFRGAPWFMYAWAGGVWEEDPRYLLIASSEGYDCIDCPSWHGRGEQWSWVDVGLSGPGPDTILVPDVAAPGPYRLCTANTGDQVYCVQLTVAGERVAPPPTTTTTIVSPELAVIDLSMASAFGVPGVAAVDVEAVITEVGGTLGAVTWDTDWQSMPPEFSCTRSDSYRTVWWGDFRMTFERSADTGTWLTAWSVGDPEVSRLAPLGPLPPTTEPATGLATQEGIRIGSSTNEAAALLGDRIQGPGPDRFAVLAGALVTSFVLDDDFLISGIGSGRNDCVDGEGL